MPMKTIRDAILIVIIAAALGFGVNAARVRLSMGGLPLSTPWPDNRKIQKLAVPPSYQPGDSLISLEDAYNLFLQKKAIFIDARGQSEYSDGHIKGALNLPFEEWDSYWESVKGNLSPDTEIVAYCEGLDCELSLFLERELKQQGYKKTYTFFGGWLTWKDEGLPIESSKDDK